MRKLNGGFSTNPANPVVKYIMWRRALKIAREIEKDLKNNL